MRINLPNYNLTYDSNPYIWGNSFPLRVESFPLSQIGCKLCPLPSCRRPCIVMQASEIRHQRCGVPSDICHLVIKKGWNQCFNFPSVRDYLPDEVRRCDLIYTSQITGNRLRGSQEGHPAVQKFSFSHLLGSVDSNLQRKWLINGWKYFTSCKY